MTPEAVTALVVCLTGAFAVFCRKSKCFIRADGQGNRSWGLGFTDRPIVPKTPRMGKEEDEAPSSPASSEEHGDGRQDVERLGHGLKDFRNRSRNLHYWKGGRTTSRPRRGGGGGSRVKVKGDNASLVPPQPEPRSEPGHSDVEQCEARWLAHQPPCPVRCNRV